MAAKEQSFSSPSPREGTPHVGFPPREQWAMVQVREGDVIEVFPVPFTPDEVLAYEDGYAANRRIIRTGYSRSGEEREYWLSPGAQFFPEKRDLVDRVSALDRIAVAAAIAGESLASGYVWPQSEADFTTVSTLPQKFGTFDQQLQPAS